MTTAVALPAKPAPATNQQLDMVLFVTGYRHFPTLARPDGIPIGAHRAAEERWNLRADETFGHGWRHWRDLRPILLNQADFVQIGFEGFEAAPAAGWVTGRVDLRINSWQMGAQPMTFYAGAATDWPTGIASWHQPYNVDDSPLPPPVWQLALRRSR